VSKRAAITLSISLLVPALSGCSLAGPSDVAFEAKAPSAKALKQYDKEDIEERLAEKMETDAAGCRSVARQSGIRSLLAIAQSVNQRNTDAAYKACMKKKGYKIQGEVEAPEEEVSPNADMVPAGPEPE
jgi:hypothetical protein